MTLTIVKQLASLILLSGSSHAATVASSAFDVDPASTGIDTTAANVVDWGYYMPGADFLDGTQAADTNFDSITADVSPATNSKASSGIGAVTITERDAAEYSNGTDLALWEFTVGAGDGTNFSGGIQTAFGAANGIGGTENIFTITFNDLGVGIQTITLYMAHTNTGRSFQATMDDVGSTSLTSSSIGGSDGFGYFTFTTEVTITDALDDLAISIDSNGGGSGQFAFAGYTVTGVPEPSTTALLGLGGLALILRRRRG
ncbi:MAG: PEP-CTERM sorting domain-containing protein [Akkermansiaceae bacterium]|nr:PEP-CTERM sorting domain-containing protein [Akkermansiaceae bacterium]